MPYPRRLSADSSRCPYNNTDPKTVVERLRPPNPMSTLQIYGSYAMTSEEQELLEQYLTYRNVLGDEGTHPSIDAWYQEVRHAQGPNAPQSLEEASELRYKDVLDAARVFNRLQENPRPLPRA